MEYNHFSEQDGGKYGKYDWKSFLLCMFLGWLGIHRFYRKQYITGFIWMFSFGLVGLGWAYDFICHTLNRIPFIRFFAQVDKHDMVCSICTNYPFECTLCQHKHG